MKKEIEKLVKSPNNTTMLYELTEERKEHLMKVSDEVVDLLAKRVAGPIEAAIVVHFLQETLEETIGAKVGALITEDDVQS